jgi:large subunit ribosomal protein L4
MPRKMRRLALRSAFSAKAAVSAIALVEGPELGVPKTKAMSGLVDAVSSGAATLFVLSGRNENVQKSIRNLPNARYLSISQLNVRDLMRHKFLLIEAEAIGALVGHLGTVVPEPIDA